MKVNMKSVALVIAAMMVPMAVGAQVPGSVMSRVLYLRVGNQTGTAFAIEWRDKQYLVTANHLVNSLPKTGVTVQLFQTGDWKNLTVDILSCDNPDTDIAVLKIPFRLINADPVGYTLGDLFVGQEVYFLGFPDGLHSYYPSGEYAAFVKRGTASAVDSTNTDSIILYVDGFNNPGFSGGPVAFLDRKNNQWKIAAVVSGYRSENAKIKIGRNYTNTNVLVNSGILIAYSIQHALDAIDKASRIEIAP